MSPWHASGAHQQPSAFPFGSGSLSRSSGFATVIITGLSSEIAQTLVTIGVDLTKAEDGRDLQRGIEETERLPGNQISHVSA